MSTTELMHAVNFDDDDLAINRQGHMSEKQTATLRRAQLTFVSFAVILMGTILSGFVSFALDLMRRQLDGGKTLGTFILMIVTLVLIAFVVHKWKQLSEDLNTNAVASASGKVSLTLIPQGRNLTYRLKVGDTKFDTSWKIYRRIERGKHYRIYYAPRSKRILSIERSH